MKKFLKWAMLVYNLLALSFFPWFLMAFLPDTCFLWNIAFRSVNALSIFASALIALVQQFFIPQIIALLLIGLYVNELRLDSYAYSIKAELPGAVWRCVWTAFSAIYMLLTYLALAESYGSPLT